MSAQRYRSKPTECEAMQWVALPNSPEHGLLAQASAIVAWVNDGGEARYEAATDDWYTSSPECFDQHPARIAIRTINGWAYAAPGHYVVMSSARFTFQADDGVRDCRDFYPCDPETFEQRWEPAE